MFWVGEGLRRPKWGLIQVKLEFLMSWRGQTSALNYGGSKEVKMGLISFGIEIHEVCENSECVTDQCFGW